MVSLRQEQTPRAARGGFHADLVRVDWSGTWETLLAEPVRSELETAALPRFLRSQRWFGGKSRTIRAVRLNSPLFLPGETASPPPALVFARVEYTEGPSEDYFLPLAVATDREADLQRSAEPDSLVARLEGPGGSGVIFDGLLSRETVIALVDFIADGRTLEGRLPVLEGAFTPALNDLLWLREGYRISRGPATSSNSFVLVGDQLLLKVFRRMEPGINPDVEIGEYLSRRPTAARVPRLGGTLSARTGGGDVTLAILQEKVESEGDGWAHVMEQLERYFAPAWGCPETPKGSVLEFVTEEPPQRLYRLLAESRVTAGLLGTRTAELHVALASGAEDPAFAPEMMSPEDFARLREAIHAQADQALTLLKSQYRELPVSETDIAARLLAREREIAHRIDASVPSRCTALRHRVHGDYHLGQVLWTGHDYVVLDFEGEPMRPLEERRAKQSPFKDVAGMLRSFHYAAFTASRVLDGEPSTDAKAWARAWYTWTSAAFLRDYLLTTRMFGLVPENMVQMHGLLEAYLLEKAFYELAYELNNRPEWVGIPLRGLMDILDT